MRFAKSAGSMASQLLSVFLCAQTALAIVTTGVTSNGVGTRLEIRDLQKNTDQWNLYILGLQRFMNVKQSDPLSYYQIAGIHGVPYSTYDGVTCVNQGGYCPHVATLFGTWHRPYLALFEQAWYSNVLEVVNSFPAGATRNRYAEAAKTLRMPYWDWAMTPPDGNTVPQIIRDKTISVTTPSGAQTIANPLYMYKFNPLTPSDMLGTPYTIWGTTFRRPVRNDPDDAHARSNNNMFNTVMNSNRASLSSRLYNIFMNQALTFNEVSTECVGNGCGNTNSHDSLESVHDTIHTVSGGPTGGHMYYLDFSAMDPVFWLHHTNMDRYFAMYQVMYPNKFLTPGTLQSSNCQWTKGESKNAYTPLKPFKKNSSGAFWTSVDVKSTTALGYNYPETANNADAASVRAAITKLYGSSSSSSKKRSTIGGDRDYKVTFNAEKHSMSGSYQTYVFVGPHNSTNGTADPCELIDSPNFAGIYGVLSSFTQSANGTNSTMGHGGNYQQLKITGEIPLNTVLEKKVESGELADLSEETVTAYLTKYLQWQVTDTVGSVVPPESVPGLTVNLVSNAITTTVDGLLEFGDAKSYPDVTKNKPAGATAALEFVQEVVGDLLGTSTDETTEAAAATATAEGSCEPAEIEYVDQAGNFLYSERNGEMLI